VVRLLQVSEAQAAAEEARAQLPQLREQVDQLTAARGDLQVKVDELTGKLQVGGQGQVLCFAGSLVCLPQWHSAD
jgi:hypothetical protein